MEKIQAVSIGKKALEILKEGGQLRVNGITSKGVFLETDSGWTLFLSSERYRGPLTINMPELAQIKRKLEKGMKGVYDAAEIGLGKVRVDLSGAQIWEEGIGKGEIQQSLDTIQKSEHPVVRFIFGQGEFPGDLASKLRVGMQKVSEAVSRLDRKLAVEGAGEMLGLGRGLTPEGDDFLIGIISCLCIANNISAIQEVVDQIVAEITHLAGEKTTRLSANLIECAAEGQVDERISGVIETILTGEGFDDAVDELMTWGNSSGRMALGGIVSGVLALAENS